MIRLIDVYDKRGEPIKGSIEYLYQLMQERDPEVNISHRQMPTPQQHEMFVRRRPFRLWYMIEIESPVTWTPWWIGYVSATHLNEIGIVLTKHFRGQGLGPAAILAMMRMHKPAAPVPSLVNGKWLANIAPGNDHSRHLFQDKLGFRKIAETYELTEEEPHGQQDAAPAIHKEQPAA